MSPFLFGAYEKKLTSPRLISNSDSSRLVISYVDDVLLCLSASSLSDLRSLAESAWASLVLDASAVGMSFAENKTNTLHDRVDSWGIGSTVKQLRFLGYWIETPPPSSRTAPPSFAYHVSHWITKANLAFNTLRALTLRSTTGLRSVPILRFMDACVRSPLLYRLEFWGHDEALTRRADAFIYGTLRNLVDLPFPTPHCAISSEFSALPVSLCFRQISRRIAARRLVFDPLRWLDPHLISKKIKLASWTSDLSDTPDAKNRNSHSGCPGGASCVT